MSSPPPNGDPSPAPSGTGASGGAATGGGEVPALIAERATPLLQALEQRLPGSLRHADGTASWALAISAELGLDRARCLSVRETARLHEIGKLYAEAALLERPEEELSPQEHRRLDAGADAGSQLAAGAGVPAAACAWIRHSRERFDGSGVPDGLFGGAIPLESRIIRTACAFDRALAGGSEGSATAPAGALTAISGSAGTELDPQTVEALSRVLARAGLG